MRIRKGKLRLSPNEEAQLIKEETERRRKLRLQQVREQSKENAAKIRNAVKQEKHRQLMKLANEIKGQLESEKAERVRHLEQQYDNSLRNIGVGHKQAYEQPNWDEERELIQQVQNLRAEARGRSAIEKEKRDISEKKQEARKHVETRKTALEVERQRAAEVASMPPPPPDPLQNLNTAKPKPVKVLDMEHFSTSHYHLQNEHVIDKAGPEEQEDAREAAELEAERIKERALELKRLRQDQLERARLRHNQALERELLKHDYNNILHDLSDLQREDRERRLKVVHNIPKQVFEPPNFRMEDRDDKQRQMEQDFEDMYMAGTDYQGDINMTLGPTPHPGSQISDDSLDVTLTENGTPLREPTLPVVPPVLRDMTNMPKAKSQGKKPEKVLRSLMNKIKTQREDWIHSHSMMEVGEMTQQQGQNGGEFVQMVPEESPVPGNQEVSRDLPAPVPGSQFNRRTVMPPTEFSAQLRAANDRQQTNVQVEPQVTPLSQPVDLQQIELAEILKQQELILEQKKQLEMKLQQLSQEQQKFQMSGMTSGPLPGQGTVQPIQGTIQQPGQATSQPQNQAVQQQVPLPHGQGPNIYQNGLPKQQTNLQIPVGQPNLVPTSVQVSASVEQQQQSMLNQQYLQQQQQLLAQQQHQQHQQEQLLAQQQEQQMIAQQQQQQLLAQQQQEQQILAQQQQHHFGSSLSSSGMSSQHPMNSIPPTGTTHSVPMTTMVQGHPRPVRSAYQPVSAALTTEQLGLQSQPYVSASQPQQNGTFPTQIVQNASHLPPGFNTTGAANFSSIHTASLTTDPANQRVSYPGHVTPGSLTSEAHNSQMQKIREYQRQLLMRHEQSKRVLEETKAEIKKRRENLMQRYPKLDLSRLEDLGAKYLQNGHGQQQATSVQPTRPDRTHDQSQMNGTLDSSVRASQGTGVPVTQLLASLASHPYYKATLSQPGQTGPVPPPPQATHITIGSVHIAQPHPDIDENKDVKKNKLDGVRKSLPFDADESFQHKTPLRVYEAYTQKHLDNTSGTDPDTSALTEKESPEFKNMSTVEDTDVDTTLSGSFLSDKKDPSSVRQEELHAQLLEIQRQKEDIIKKHMMGQQKLQQKETELKQKLATVVPTQQADNNQVKQQEQIPPPSTQTEFLLQNGHQNHDLSTILEVDTPASTRPSDTGRLSISSSDSGSLSYPQPPKRALDYTGVAQNKPRVEAIAEEPGLEEVETQMQKEKSKGKGGPVADYSGKNIDNVLERAKRFETEVLEKLRKQTNAVLFDNEFDDSLEFNTSRRQVSGDNLSSGSLSAESFSTGPLEDSSINKTQEAASKSASVGRTWADELAEFKSRPSGQSDKSFKEMHPETGRNSVGDRPLREDTIFTGDINRFTVYSKINDSDKSISSSEEQAGQKMNGNGGATLNAEDMLSHLRELQRQLRDEGEAREALAKKLEQVQHQTTKSNKLEEEKQANDNLVSRPFMSDTSKSDLSQYSITDKSTDTSLNDAPKVKTTFESPIQSGTSSRERELPVRRSPIGDNARSESPTLAGSQSMERRQEVTLSEYSFGTEDSKQRSTSTPGDDRRKSSLGTQVSVVNKSELPSEITMGDKSVTNSVGVRFSTDFKPRKEESRKPADHTDLSSYTVSSVNDSSKFDTFSPEKQSENMAADMTADMTTYSVSSAEDSLKNIKEQFQRLAPVPAARQKIKTYAVSRDGDLISEQSDSDRSSGNFLTKTNEGLTSYSMSTQQDNKNDTNSTNYGLSSYSVSEPTQDDKRLSQLSEYTIKSSVTSDSSPRSSNPQSSSFTNVTSDPSFNASGLSQYTIPEKVENLSSQNTNENNYLQQKFASLDNLIIESKSLIARHKVMIDKNKQVECDTAPPIPTSLPPPLKSISKAPKSEPMITFSSAKSDVSRPTNDSQLSKNSSLNESSKTGDQSSDIDFRSLDYVTEHSSGITEEAMPELSTMTIGSEISISDAFNKMELSDSGDSLKSFERHEMSESESLTTSNVFDDDSRTEQSKSEHSKTDRLQEIVEARKHNFMVQSERVAVAAKERAMSQRNKPEDKHPVFRAIPVSVVASPTLSMSVNVPGAENGKAPSALQIKTSKSVIDTKKTFEEKERENSAPVTSKLPLNRALQPRDPDSPRESTDKPVAITLNSRAKDLSGASSYTRSLSAPAPSGKSALLGEIKNFGGSLGFTDKPQTPSPAKKTPPKVLPKPVRNKVGFAGMKTSDVRTTKSVSAPQASGFSKTLSSWKKSRAIHSKSSIPEPTTNKDAPKNSIRVLPKDAPVLLSEEEKRLKMEEELYEKNIRLQHRLDTTDEADTSQEKPKEKPKETKRDTASKLRK